MTRAAAVPKKSFAIWGIIVSLFFSIPMLPQEGFLRTTPQLQHQGESSRWQYIFIHWQTGAFGVSVGAFFLFPSLLFPSSHPDKEGLV